jgi:hypothetical protein
MNSPFVYFIGGVIGVFVVSMISDSLVERSAVKLDQNVRSRVFERQATTSLWWRIADGIGFLLMLVGMAKAAGMIKASGSWGIPSMAIGLAVVCIASSMRAWMAQRAYGVEAPQTPASKSATTAAILVSASELILALLVCSFVFTSPRVTGGGGNTQPKTKPAGTAAAAAGTPEKSPEETLWVDQNEALRLLKGKSPEYLEALVARQDIRDRNTDGKREYRRDDISAMKIAGLPSEAELKLAPVSPPKEIAIPEKKDEIRE